jgi:hypothetical protein
MCGETFEIERKAGRPRKYCPECLPPGFQVVKLPYRTKLRRRPPLFAGRPGGHKVLDSPVGPMAVVAKRTYVGKNYWPEWSPSGQRIAYVHEPHPASAKSG